MFVCGDSSLHFSMFPSKQGERELLKLTDLPFFEQIQKHQLPQFIVQPQPPIPEKVKLCFLPASATVNVKWCFSPLSLDHCSQLSLNLCQQDRKAKLNNCPLRRFFRPLEVKNNAQDVWALTFWVFNLACAPQEKQRQLSASWSSLVWHCFPGGVVNRGRDRSESSRNLWSDG